MDKTRLIDDIILQIRNLERLNEEMDNLLARIKEEPDFIEIRACASIRNALIIVTFPDISMGLNSVGRELSL